MILGFPRRASVLPGEALELCVATEAPAFRVELHRWGAALEPVVRAGPFPGRAAPHHLPHHDWSADNVGLRGEDLPAWPSYAIPLPADLRPGVHVAVLLEGDDEAPPPPPDARSARALVVVRSPAPGTASTVLYKLPLLTYHAYNQVSPRHWHPREHRAGGWCLYSEFLDLPLDGLPAVSVRRPGGGTGATTFDTFNPDPFDPSPRQTFTHWDALALGWLEAEGFAVDVCTDLDLHGPDGDALLAAYRLLVSVGHDEYWSEAMRTCVERFVAAGGNAAFLGGNTCWWEVTFDDEHAYRRAGHWSSPPPAGAGRPENAMTGVSFRNGGERPLGLDAPAVGFRVQHADHPLLAGTGLRDGDVFGAGPDEHLVGYECDGAHFDRARVARGRPAEPTGADGTPADFAILGVGDVGASGWGAGNRAATLGVHAPGGTVFTAATTDWARLLARGDGPVAGITANVNQALR